jgi:hypothetical protein
MALRRRHEPMKPSLADEYVGATLRLKRSAIPPDKSEWLVAFIEAHLSKREASRVLEVWQNGAQDPG